MLLSIKCYKIIVVNPEQAVVNEIPKQIQKMNKSLILMKYKLISIDIFAIEQLDDVRL